MKRLFAFVLVAGLITPLHLFAQASAIPSAAPVAPAGMTPEQQGKKLLDQMLEALGGEAWLNRKDMQVEGRSASFFQGAPNGMVVEFTGWRRFSDDAERIAYGKKRDVVQVWANGNGYEVTYKGRTELPKDQVTDYYRRQKHSIEAVIRDWIKAPGVMIVAEGQSTVDRHIADKLTVLSADNDAVTLELDATSHLPLRRTFRWRNETFKDYDEEAETYGDYHTVQGIPTPYNATRYRNGDMVSQRFLTSIIYAQGLSPDLFNPDNLLKKKK